MSPSTNSPTIPPPGSEPVPAKKRGFKFWLKLAGGVLLALPLLAYFGAWACLNFGFLNRTIEARLTKKLGATAHIGSINGQALHGLKLEKISIEALDKGAPLTVESTSVEWQLSELLDAGRLRAVIVEHPQIDLRHDLAHGWNYKFKLASADENEVQIGRFEIKQGYFSTDLGTAGKLKLSKLDGVFTDMEKRAPSPFSLRGELGSGEPFVVEGSAGPVAGDFNVRVIGQLGIERSLPGLLGFNPGAQGDVRFQFSSRGEAAERAQAAKTTVSVTVNLKNILCRVPQLGETRLAIPFDNIDFEAQATQPKPDANAFELRGLRINSGRFGNFSANGVIETDNGGCLRIFDAGGLLELAALNSAFAPPPLGGTLRIQGSAEVSDMTLRAPFGAAGPPMTFDALITSRRLLLDVPGLGNLPPVDFEALIAWPGLKRCVVKMADVGSLELSVDDLSLGGDSLSALELLRIKKLRVDLGQFFDGALGRRLLANTPSGGTPPLAADMPYSFSGVLSGAPVTQKWSAPFSPGGSGALNIAGLSAENLSLRKWPLLMRPPRCSFAGPLTADVEFVSGKPSRATLSAEIKGALDAPVLNQPVARRDGNELLALKLKYAMAALPDGTWTSQNFEATDVRSSIVGLDEAFRFLDGTGVSITGELSSERIHFNPALKSLDGNAHLEKAACVLPVSDSLRATAAEILRALNHNLAAALLQSLGLVDRVTLSEMSADVEFHDAGGVFSVQGTTGPFFVSLKLPLIGDYRAAQIPGMKFQIQSTQRADGSYFHTGKIEFQHGILSSDVTQLNGGKWTVSGKYSALPRGFEVAFNGAFDDPNHLAGPFKITTPRVELAALQELFSSAMEIGAAPRAVGGADAWRGALTQLNLEIAPLSFGGTLLPAMQARLTGKMDDVAFSCDGHAVEKLSGPFTLIANGGRESVSVDAQATLESYNAVLCGGTLPIPQPPPGASSALKLAFRVPGNGAADASVRLEKIEASLAGLMSFSANGALRRNAGGAWTATELNDILILIPDLAAINASLGPLNLKRGEIWPGDMQLEGRSNFKGAAHWDAAGHFGIDGKIALEQAGLRIGREQAFAAERLDGEIPVSLRRDGGPPRDGGPRATLRAGKASYGSYSAENLAVEIEALSNGFVLHTPLTFNSYAGSAALGPVEIGNLWPISADPRISFRLVLNIDAGQILRANAIPIPGTEACVLSGPPMECALIKNAGLRGPWELLTGATRECKGDNFLTAPFLDGQLVLTNLNAHGIFGPAPLLGGSLLLVGKNWPERNQGGISAQEMLKNFPKFGQFNARFKASIRNFELSSLDLNGLQNFTLDVDAAGHHKEEFFFDGKFAMAANYTQARAAFPALFSDDYIRELTFGINDFSFQLQLDNGILKGPRAKLPGGLILEGYGAESNPFATRYKKDIRGDFEYQIQWRDFLRLAREKLK